MGPPPVDVPPLQASGVTLVDPAPGTIDVPRNLAAVWVRFPGPVSAPDGALGVMGQGAGVMVAPPVADGCPDGGTGVCVRMELLEQLGPGQVYLVAVGAGVADADGRELPAGVLGQFTTAVDADRVAPAINALSVQPSGPCVLVSFTTNEIAQTQVRIRDTTWTKRISAGSGAMAFSVAASLTEFPAGGAVEVVVEAQDRAGNLSESAAVALTIPEGLLPIAITEVHANPAGAEPTQEFVEVRNLGLEPIDLAGLAIADAKGMDVLPGSVLGPGAYGLIIPSGFDPAGPKDTPPQAGTLLVRVDTRLGSDGLSNGGEVVRLLAPGGNVISSYSSALDVSASAWAGQSVHRVPEDACDQEASWSRRPAAATPGWGPP